MNYYIQGDAAKADKIRAAFEKLGYDVTGFDMCNDNILFFTYKLQTGANVISTTNAHLYTANIIKTHPDYKELKLPVEPKFKVGDWLVYENGDTFAGGSKSVQVKSVEDYRYIFTQNTTGSFRFIDMNCRLWAIADAKDGDVLHHSCTASNGTFIFKCVNESGKIFCHCDYDSEDHFCLGEYHHIPHSPDSKFVHPATKEQRYLLFAKMKEAGYQWDADKKELHKIKPHYDIANFQPFDKVLVRCSNDEEWMIEFYCKYDTLVHTSPHRDYPFIGICDSYSQCIPFEWNEHLLGTTDMPSEEYINW